MRGPIAEPDRERFARLLDAALIPISTVAAAMGCSESTVRRRLRAGELEGLDVGRDVFVVNEAVRARILRAVGDPEVLALDALEENVVVRTPERSGAAYDEWVREQNGLNGGGDDAVVFR